MTVTTWQWEAERGHLRPVQIVPTLPPDYTGENTASEIAVAPDARFLYCSNRGHDTIAAFAVNPATGLLSPVSWTPSQGRTPRFIALDPKGRTLYAANEQSDTIVAFQIDPTTGKLTPTGQPIQTPSPVSIVL